MDDIVYESEIFIDPYIPRMCRSSIRSLCLELIAIESRNRKDFEKLYPSVKRVKMIPAHEMIKHAFEVYDGTSCGKPLTLERFRGYFSEFNLERIFLPSYYDSLNTDEARKFLDYISSKDNYSKDGAHTLMFFVGDLIELIVYTAKQEEELVKQNCTYSFLKAMNPLVDLINEQALKLSAYQYGVRLAKDKLSRKIGSAASGAKAHRSKQPIFDGFIEWSFSLDCPSVYRFPKHAAQDYLESVVRNEAPSLYKLKTATTVRTMCEKLADFCSTNNQKNPFDK